MTAMKTPEEQQQEYNEIEALVYKYQDGHNQADAIELIDKFTPFLTKYINLIKNGIFDFHNKDLRNFIMMFIPDEFIRSKLRKSRHSTEVKRVTYNAVSLVGKTCECYTAEDLSQELNIILLTMAQRYKQKGKSNFCGYIFNVFRFELYRKLVHITRDPLTFSNGLSDYTNEEDFTQNEMLYIVSPSIISNESSLDYNWIQGLSCSDEFANLNQLERLILKLTYEDRYTDIEISNKIGIHRHTVRKKKIKIMKKLEEIFGEAVKYPGDKNNEQTE